MTGHWAMTSGTGWALARVHNEYTFEYFPWQSIDRVWAELHRQMDTIQVAERRAVAANEFALDQWYRDLAIEYIREHPWETLRNGIYKVGVIFSGIHSPMDNWLKNSVYAVSYWLLTILALISLPVVWRTSFVRLYLAMLVAYSLATFVFWSHTSHRAFLDPPLAVLAGIGLAMIIGRIDIERPTN